MVFAFRLSKNAGDLAKLLVSLYDHKEEYLPQLIMRMHDAGASTVSIEYTGDGGVWITGDCDFDKHELSLLQNWYMHLLTAPYALTLQHFNNMTIEGRIGEEWVSNGVVRFENYNWDVEQTRIRLSGRKKDAPAQKAEEKFLKDIFRESDLEILIDGEPVQEDAGNFQYSQNFNTLGLSGKIEVKIPRGKSKLYQEVFYHRGRKLVSHEFIPGFRIVLHNHPFSPNVSYNGIVTFEHGDESIMEDYVTKRNKIINGFLKDLFTGLKEWDEEFSRSLVRYIMIDVNEAMEQVLDEETYAIFRSLKLFSVNGAMQSFDSLKKANEIYVDPGDFYQIVGSKYKNLVAISEKDAGLFGLLGARLKNAFDNPRYFKMKTLSMLPNAAKFDSTLKYKLVQKPEDTKYDSLHQKPAEAKGIIQFLSDFGIDVSIYRKAEDDPILKENSEYKLNIANPTIKGFLYNAAKNRSFAVPIIYHICSDYYSKPENQRINGGIKSTEKIVDAIVDLYLKSST